VVHIPGIGDQGKDTQMSDEENAARQASSQKKSADAPFADPAASKERRAPEVVSDVETDTSKDAPAPTDEEIAQAVASEKAKEEAVSGKKGGIIMRRSRWYSSLAALRYVSSLSKDDDLRVRDSDRATSIFLLIGSILTVLSLLIKPLAGHRLQFVLVCDALVGVMLVFYVANRFGILNTLTPRQALLTWQLMMGASFLGIFLTINLAVMIALLVANTSIELH